MYLFFDTETTGLAKDFNAPATDLENWPRITQIGWQLYDEDENLVNEFCSLIKPDNWTIPTVEELEAQGNKNPNFFVENNMSTERCEAEGVPLTEVLEKLVEDMEKSTYLIAHNMDFDKKVVSAEFIRYQVKPKNKLEKLCTMKESTDYCKLKNNWRGYKWPTLVELHNKLFDEDFEGAHDALADVKACSKSFFELKKRGVMLKPKPKVHNLKTWPEYFEEVKNDSKKFEVRKNDRDYKVNDILNLEEYCPEKEDYTGEKLSTKVDYILSGGEFGVEDGFVVMSITKT